MNRALKLPIFLTGFFLSLLVSFSAFSMSARAEVIKEFPATYGYKGVMSYDYVAVNTSIPNAFKFAFLMASNGRYYPCCVFDTYVSSYTFYYRGGFSYSQSTTVYDMNSIVFNGTTYYYSYVVGAEINTYQGATPNSLYLYNSVQSALADYESSLGPEYADFGFNNITYTTYLQPTSSLLFESYNFDALSYYFNWNGSTDSDYPITSFNYELYGFFDTAMDNTDKSNGELVDSGSHSIPNVFDYQVPYGSLTDVFGGMKYDKVILYLTPYSNITEGNTFYVVLNTVRNIAFNVNLGPLIGFEFGGSVRDVQYSDGVLPVPQTDALLIEDDKYMPVGYIDEVPVIYAVRSVSGSYNRHIDIYHENISYAPVIYGDSEYITNNDNSSVINNNQTYNTIINNINGTINIDPDNNSSVNSLVDFLKTLITFFATCWNMFSSFLTFIPSWAVNIVTGFYSLTGSILVGLVILKLIRG